MRVAFCHKPPGVVAKNLVTMAKLNTERGTGAMTPPDQVARQTAVQPEGYRCVQIVIPWEDAAGLPTWLDRHEGALVPAAETFRRDQAGKYADWWQQFQAAGGLVDFVVCDWEASLDWQSVVLLNGGTAESQSDLQSWLNGTAPAAQALRSRLGISDFNSFRLWGGTRDQRELQWNAALHNYVAGLLHEVFYQPARQFYPHIRCVNYEHAHYANAIRSGSHRRYSQCWTAGTGCHVGTHSGRPFYGQVAISSDPWWFESPAPAPTPRRALEEGVTWARSLGVGSLLSAQEQKPVPWAAWITSPEQTDPASPARFAFYQAQGEWLEQVRHIFGCGAEFLCYWHNRGVDPRGDLLSWILSDCDEHLPAAGTRPPSGDVLLGEFPPGVLATGWPDQLRMTYWDRSGRLSGRWLSASVNRVEGFATSPTL